MSSYILRRSLATVCLMALGGCANLEPIRAQIDDLQSQITKLQADISTVATTTAKQAADASVAARSAQDSVNQLRAQTEANAAAIAALDEKIDRMFKRPSLAK
jgi:phage shock protein A